MSEATKLIFYTTCRIVNHTINNKTKHGTGFFMNYKFDNGDVVRVVLTCKHVIENYKTIEVFSCLDDGSANPIDTVSFCMKYEIGSNDELVVKHPIEDLAALIFSYNDKIFLKGNRQPYYLSLEEQNVPPNKTEEIDFIQSIIMVGFPEKVYDKFNNKPIVRRGVTATPFQNNFDGKKQFLLDIASFHGSSGSPVFLLDDAPFMINNVFVPGPRFYLLGMFTGGWEELNDAYKSVEASIDGIKQNIKVKLPNNIGYVLKSEVFIEIKPLLYSLCNELGLINN